METDYGSGLGKNEWTEKQRRGLRASAADARRAVTEAQAQEDELWRLARTDKGSCGPNFGRAPLNPLSNLPSAVVLPSSVLTKNPAESLPTHDI